MLKSKYNGLQFVIVFGYLLSIIGIIVLPGILSAGFSLFYTVCTIVVGWYAVKKRNRKASTTVLLLPVIMSALQNIYLGLGANRLNETYLQVLLSLHFLLFSGIVLFSINDAIKRAWWVVASIATLLIQAAVMYVIYPSSFTSALSSIRNILSCMLIYCFGIIMYRSMDVTGYYKWIKKISWFVVIFGLFEWFAGLGIWQALNITKLWELKKIPLPEWGIPPNWYSSEQIGGSIVRRMVSSFADPVNLGTFLFAAFMIAWYRKEKLLTYALGICAVLTVSKGSLLGFLVFLVIYVWENKKMKYFVPMMAGFVLVAGIYFIRFSRTSSSGSVFAHVYGFINAFSVLKAKPLGLGVGNVGVLAGLFNETLLDTSVSETGIGMIIAQLGIIGLTVYVFFFTKLGLQPLKWRKSLQRERILYYTILFSFIANAMFNEVALSPNSCGLYFIELAFLQNTFGDHGKWNLRNYLRI